MALIKLIILAAAVVIVVQLAIGLVSDHGAAAQAHREMVHTFGHTR